MVMLDSPEERADKALRLNGFDNFFDNLIVKLPKAKPTLRIKRLSYGNSGIKLKGASNLNSNLQRQLMERERINAEKALRLNSLI